MRNYNFLENGVYGKHFCGNEISAYGLEHNRVDYATLAKAFDAVLNNNIMNATYDVGYWEQESGFVDNEEDIEEIRERIEELLSEKYDIMTSYELNDDEREQAIGTIENTIDELEEEIDELEREQEEYPDVFQTYIVSAGGAEILEDINEIVWYNDELDMYVWGVTHWGTGWDYVLTDIPCNTGKF